MNTNDSSQRPALHVLNGRKAPWGDYGDALTHGVADRDEVSGLLRVSRTGPFVPPIFFAGWSVVVDDALCTALNLERFTGFELRPVIKKRIVKLDWHLWDKSLPVPAFYPESGEPEDYVLAGVHSPETSEVIGPIWELYAHICPGLQAAGGLVDCTYYSDQDMCRGSEPGCIFTSARLREWLEDRVGEWVTFTPAIHA